MRELLKALDLIKIGNLEFARELSGGKASAVCVYEDPEGRECCFKFLVAPRNEEELELFRQENAALISLGETEAGRFAVKAESEVQQAGDLPVYYFAFNYFVGETLSDVIKRDPFPWDTTRAVQMLHRVVCALSPALGAGVAHRDLHPGNIFVVSDDWIDDPTDEDSDPGIRILDFGLAKNWFLSFLERSDKAGLRHSGAISSWSPEYLDAPANVQPSHDIWSLGVLSYRMLVGEYPFAARTFVEYYRSVARQDFDREALTRRSVSVAIRDLVEVMLLPNPSERASVREVTKYCFDFLFNDLSSKVESDSHFAEMYRRHRGDIWLCPRCLEVQRPEGQKCGECGVWIDDFINPLS